MFGPGETGQQQQQFSSVLVNSERDVQAKLPRSFQQAKQDSTSKTKIIVTKFGCSLLTEFLCGLPD
jgi:hypothetical protein